MSYKYIEFRIIEKKSKTNVYECLNKNGGYGIGTIKWYPAWRQYVYTPYEDTVYSQGCLNDISDFIGKIKRLEPQEAKRDG